MNTEDAEDVDLSDPVCHRFSWTTGLPSGEEIADTRRTTRVGMARHDVHWRSDLGRLARSRQQEARDKRWKDRGKLKAARPKQDIENFLTYDFERKQAGSL